MNKLALQSTLIIGSALVAASASAQGGPTWLFVHTPHSGTGATASGVATDLDNLLDSLEDTLDPGGNNPPKICLFGYSGQWFPTPTSGSPNLAGTAANLVGNASDTDNRVSFLIEISYCTAQDVLTEIILEEKCDVVIGLGEGGTDGFVLEEHGDEATCIPDCNGGTNGGSDTCPGGTCGGTDWDEPAPGGGTIGGGTIGGYTGTTTATTTSNGAGAFLCGWFCCAKCCVMAAVSQAADAGVQDAGHAIDAGSDVDAGVVETGQTETPVDRTTTQEASGHAEAREAETGGR